MLTFAACQRKQCVSISINDDEVVETVELFHIGLQRTASMDSRIRLTSPNGVVAIADDDSAIKLTQLYHK